MLSLIGLAKLAVLLTALQGAALSASSIPVVDAEGEGGRTGVSAVPGPEIATTSNTDIFKLAAEMSVDLRSLPAWKAFEPLGLTPITPGPGLPSLESLKLTWADIAQPVAVDEVTSSKPRTTTLRERRSYYAGCTSSLLNRADTEWCYNYLNALGSATCAVSPAPNIRFCYSNGVAWYGHSRNGGWDSTTCANVARGGKFVMDSCGYFWNQVFYQSSGYNTAWARDNIVVTVGVNY